MERQAMYRFLQACLAGQTDYTTDEGVTFYRAPTSGEGQHGIVLDVLIDHYLRMPGAMLELCVQDIAATIEVAPDEIVRSVLALARITLVSHHIEERLIRLASAGIDGDGRLILVVGLNAWLTHHLNHPSFEANALPARVRAI